MLRALFPTYFHIGKLGDGGRAKLAVNLILGLNRLALAEGLVFAERLGLDPAAFLELARGCGLYSQVMDIKGAKMVGGDFAPEGRVTQHLKDVHLMLEQAARVKPEAAAAGDPCRRAGRLCAAGEGDRDNSIVIEENQAAPVSRRRNRMKFQGGSHDSQAMHPADRGCRRRSRRRPCECSARKSPLSWSTTCSARRPSWRSRTAIGRSRAST